MRSIWTLVVFAACTDGIDTVESRVDAPIHVTVYRHNGNAGETLAGATVEFVAPDGSTVTETTDANGVADAISPAGTTVVVYQAGDGPTQRFVKVFNEAQPGDSIIAGLRREEFFDFLPEVSFQIPKRHGASTYQFVVSCGLNNRLTSGTHVAQVTACPMATNATAIAYPLDANFAPMGVASIVRGLDLTALGGTTVKMPQYKRGDLDITAQLSNIPAGATSVQWSSINHYGDETRAFANVSTSAANGLNAAQIPDVGDRTSTTIAFDPAGYRNVRVDDVATTRVRNFVLDASQTIRPAQDATFDAATQTITWTEAPYGRAGTFATFQLLARDFSGKDVRIDLHAPTDSTSVTLPTLPPELTPLASDQLMLSGFALLIEGQTYAQYMPLIDTQPGYSPVGWDPTFRGRVWRATIR